MNSLLARCTLSKFPLDDYPTLREDFTKCSCPIPRRRQGYWLPKLAGGVMNDLSDNKSLSRSLLAQHGRAEQRLERFFRDTSGV